MNQRATDKTETVLRDVGGNDLAGSGFELEDDESRQFTQPPPTIRQPHPTTPGETGKFA